MDKKILRDLFINTLEDIKKSKSFGYATISRLTAISDTKIYNIINGKSSPKIEDVKKLLVVFPNYKSQFSEIEGLEDSEAEDAKTYDPKDIVSILHEKIALYKETKNAQRETIEALKEEIKRLRDLTKLQDKLLKDQGIDVDTEPDA